MTRTFLVAIDITDSSDPAQWAEEILSILTDEGIPVKSVNPWSSPQQTLDLGQTDLPTFATPQPTPFTL